MGVECLKSGHNGESTIDFSVDGNGRLNGNITRDSGGHSFSPLGPVKNIILEGGNRVIFLSSSLDTYELTLTGNSLRGEIDGGNWTASMVLKPGSGRVR